MKHIVFFVFFFLPVSRLFAQELNPRVNKDSLFSALLNEVPPAKRNQIKQMYDEGNQEVKDFTIIMLYLPKSSKTALIKNLNKRKEKILFALSEFKKLVPSGYTVFVEFNPSDRILQTHDTVDLKINGPGTGEDDQEWNLQYGSDELNQRLSKINWNENILLNIKKMLDDAGCISIQNGRDSAVGFARSGMGKYSYRIFDRSLTNEQIKEYNDGCTFIYYKDNIVLEYGGGAIGPQCFPD